MYAQLAATFCLLYVSIGIAYPESPSAGASVAVYLKTGTPTAPAVLTSLTRELDGLFKSSGFHLEWFDGENQRAIANVAVVELRGSCRPPVTLAPPSLDQDALPLASTSVAEGEILPFSWVNCAAVNQLLGPSLAKEPASGRDDAYGRALARLLGHELYHILTRTRAHTQSGVSKERLAATDLLCGDFQFPSDALGRLSVPGSSKRLSIPEARADEGMESLTLR